VKIPFAALNLIPSPTDTNWLLSFWLGNGSQWTRQTKAQTNLVSQIDTALRLLMWTVIVAGVLGRLDLKLADLPSGNWLAQLRAVVETSSLRDALEYFVTLLQTAALLSSIHFIVYYFYAVFYESTGGIATVAANFSPINADAIREQARVDYWKAEWMRLQAKTDQQNNSTDL
jgi:hypothetical protein